MYYVFTLVWSGTWEALTNLHFCNLTLNYNPKVITLLPILIRILDYILLNRMSFKYTLYELLDYWMGFLIQTAWYSIELHGHPMAFHGTLRDSMEFHRPPRKLHGISWLSMELHQYFMELHGYSMKFHQFPSISIDFHGFPWNSRGISHGSTLFQKNICCTLLRQFLAHTPDYVRHVL